MRSLFRSKTGASGHFLMRLAKNTHPEVHQDRSQTGQTTGMFQAKTSEHQVQLFTKKCTGNDRKLICSNERKQNMAHGYYKYWCGSWFQVPSDLNMSHLPDLSRTFFGDRSPCRMEGPCNGRMLKKELSLRPKKYVYQLQISHDYDSKEFTPCENPERHPYQHHPVGESSSDHFAPGHASRPRLCKGFPRSLGVFLQKASHLGSGIRSAGFDPFCWTSFAVSIGNAAGSLFFLVPPLKGS